MNPPSSNPSTPTGPRSVTSGTSAHSKSTLVRTNSIVSSKNASNSITPRSHAQTDTPHRSGHQLTRSYATYGSRHPDHVRMNNQIMNNSVQQASIPSNQSVSSSIVPISGSIPTVDDQIKETVQMLTLLPDIPQTQAFRATLVAKIATLSIQACAANNNSSPAFPPALSQPSVPAQVVTRPNSIPIPDDSDIDLDSTESDRSSPSPSSSTSPSSDSSRQRDRIKAHRLTLTDEQLLYRSTGTNAGINRKTASVEGKKLTDVKLTEHRGKTLNILKQVITSLVTQLQYADE